MENNIEIIDKIPDEYREVVKKELEKLNGNS